MTARTPSTAIRLNDRPRSTNRWSRPTARRYRNRPRRRIGLATDRPSSSRRTSSASSRTTCKPTTSRPSEADRGGIPRTAHRRSTAMTTTTLNPPAYPADVWPPDAPAAARVHDAVKVYGRGDNAVRALDGVTVEFATGRFTAIMGRSGSGTSTLLHAVAGPEHPTSGTVHSRRLGIHSPDAR